MAKTRLERQSKMIEDTLTKMSGEARRARDDALALHDAAPHRGGAYQAAARHFNALADQELGPQAYIVKLAVRSPSDQ